MTFPPRVKIQLIRSGAKLPEYKTAGAAGADLYLPEFSSVRLQHGDTAVIPLGFKMELSEGYEAQIRPRSSWSRAGVHVAFGTIDSDYRGEVGLVVHRLYLPPFDGFSIRDNDEVLFKAKAGDRVGQMIIAPVTQALFIEVESDLSQTERGEGGFGSTGK